MSWKPLVTLFLFWAQVYTSIDICHDNYYKEYLQIMNCVSGNIIFDIQRKETKWRTWGQKGKVKVTNMVICVNPIPLISRQRVAVDMACGTGSVCLVP